MKKERIVKIIKKLTTEQYNNITNISDEEFYKLFGCDALELCVLFMDDFEEGHIGEKELYFFKKFILELKLLRSIQVKPVQKYLTNSIHDQWQHVCEEFEEALTELINYKKESSFLNDKHVEFRKTKLLDELNDMQISIETLKTIIEPDENKRNESMIKTINKNMVRGYYNK